MFVPPRVYLPALLKTFKSQHRKAQSVNGENADHEVQVPAMSYDAVGDYEWLNETFANVKAYFYNQLSSGCQIFDNQVTFDIAKSV